MKTLYQDGSFAFFASTIEDGDFAVPLRWPAEKWGAFYRRVGWTYFWPLRNVIRKGVPPIILPTKTRDGKQETVERVFGTTHIVQAVHGDKIVSVGPISLDREQELYERNVNCGLVYHDETDGLLTDQPLCVLAVTGADCPPVLIMDPVKKAFALVHSGRKGTVLNIVGKAVRSLSLKTGTPPAKMRAIIGPGICREHYQVNDEIAREFAHFGNVLVRKVSGETHLDLPYAIQQNLLKAGLTWQNVTGSTKEPAECTYDHPETWHSFRRDTHQGLKLQRPRVQAFFATLLT